MHAKFTNSKKTYFEAFLANARKPFRIRNNILPLMGVNKSLNLSSVPTLIPDFIEFNYLDNDNYHEKKTTLLSTLHNEPKSNSEDRQLSRKLDVSTRYEDSTSYLDGDRKIEKISIGTSSTDKMRDAVLPIVRTRIDQTNGNEAIRYESKPVVRLPNSSEKTRNINDSNLFRLPRDGTIPCAIDQSSKVNDTRVDLAAKAQLPSQNTVAISSETLRIEQPYSNVTSQYSSQLSQAMVRFHSQMKDQYAKNGKTAVLASMRAADTKKLNSIMASDTPYSNPVGTHITKLDTKGQIARLMLNNTFKQQNSRSFGNIKPALNQKINRSFDYSKKKQPAIDDRVRIISKSDVDLVPLSNLKHAYEFRIKGLQDQIDKLEKNLADLKISIIADKSSSQQKVQSKTINIRDGNSRRLSETGSVHTQYETNTLLQRRYINHALLRFTW